MREEWGVVGLFERREAAESAFRALVQAGFTDEEVGVILPRGETSSSGEHAIPAGRGLTLGALVGAAEGVALEATVLAFPAGAGFVAGGTLVAAVAGAAAGAGAGAITSALADLRAGDEGGSSLEERLQGERALVTVRADDRLSRERARRILRVRGALETGGADESDGTPTFVTGFADVAGELRGHWQARLAGRGDWKYFERAYRFGWQRANRPDFAEREWPDASHEVRAEWERRTPDRSWEDVREAVEAGWMVARRHSTGLSS